MPALLYGSPFQMGQQKETMPIRLTHTKTFLAYISAQITTLDCVGAIS